MSDRPHEPTPEGEYFEASRFAGLSLLIGAIAFVALVLCMIGAAVDPLQFSFSWLFAFGFFFTLCAGCFFWTIVHHAVDAEWSVVVRRQLETSPRFSSSWRFSSPPCSRCAIIFTNG